MMTLLIAGIDYDFEGRKILVFDTYRVLGKTELMQLLKVELFSNTNSTFVVAIENASTHCPLLVHTGKLTVMEFVAKNVKEGKTLEITLYEFDSYEEAHEKSSEINSVLKK